MTTSELIRAQHLTRKAVIYVRQSTGHQVLTNLESQRMQRAMADRAAQLGWPEGLIETVEIDTGLSGRSTAGRDGYRELMVQISRGHVGIVLSYESARLSRNCSDWYPLLDVCALNGCLIGDREGTYDPSCANGRLLLGMKGILSEVELNTLRGRLTAGSLNKARRGELALCLPAGLCRLEDGTVVKDPDLRVQGAIELVFQTFLEMRSASQVARRMRSEGLELPRRQRNREIAWRRASASRLTALLKNPAYAGAYVYGRVHNTLGCGPGGIEMSRRRVERKDWAVVLKDHYPAYVSWETFEQIESILTQNRAEYDGKLTKGTARRGDTLLQGIAYCGECGHKMKIQYHRTGGRYICDHFRREAGRRVCQNLLSAPIDATVADAFFQALSPAELDVYEKTIDQRLAMTAEFRAAKERELERLRYQADLARRQYDRVDPDNRLVAAELERRWESALQALQEAKLLFEQARIETRKTLDRRLPAELRKALLSLGQSLPRIWNSIPPEHRKTLLRCLVDKVALRRPANKDLVHARVVWRGGADTELEIPLAVGSFEKIPRPRDMEARILELDEQGRSEEEIAQILTEEGFRSPRDTSVLPATVRVNRLRLGRRHRYKKSRTKQIDGFLTVPQLAAELGLRNEWFYHRIRTGAIDVALDPDTGLYLFPDRPETRQKLQELRDATRIPQQRRGASL